MKCSNCNSQNKDKSKFCINCGTKLEKTKMKSENFCSNCGSKKNTCDMFCVNCGEKFGAVSYLKNSKKKKINNQHTHKRYIKEKNFNILNELKKHKVYTATVIFIIGYIFFQVIPQDSDYKVTNNLLGQLKPNVPLYGNANTNFNQVASKFVCSCGTCGELSLETCGCPTAIKEHEYINSLLSQNSTIDQTVIALANKYGWLKSQYYQKYNVDKNKVWFGGVSKTTTNIIGGTNLIGSQNITPIASIADRNTIISKFECPCGQCNVKELIQCECTHPNGAFEVKEFIDQLILERNNSVEQIITKVNNKYSGRKI